MENLIENPFKKTNEDDDEKKKRPVIKSATDLQRLKLEKLMKNPDKPIIIPEQPREKDYMQTVPSFVRNVMGSSAGAGSGEFHVYRHLRRKEYARQKCIQAKSIREQLDEEYQMKLEKNRLEAEAKTAKKRAKRMKRKQRSKKPRKKENAQKDEEKNDNTSEEDEEDEDANQEDEKSNDVMETVGPSLKESSDQNLQVDEECKDARIGSGEEGVQVAAPKDQEAEKDEDVPPKELTTDASTGDEEVQVAGPLVQEAKKDESKETMEDVPAKELTADKSNESTRDEEVLVAGPKVQKAEEDETKMSAEDVPTKKSVADDIIEKNSSICDKANESTSVEQKSNAEELPK